MRQLSPIVKGLIVAAVHVTLVASLGAKMLYDRATRPRVWTRAAPFDPNLPIRGRYVSLQLVVEARGIQSAEPTSPSRLGSFQMQPVVLRVEGNKLIAEAKPQERHFMSSGLFLSFIERRGEKLAVLNQPVAFFIPEHVDDPSRRPPGEQLWVEVTIPDTGPPRPIRLGLKSNEGPITPLEIR